jgi:tyrosinase
MWNTCQSHSGQNSNYFLPWHRMYLFFMESIVRQVSGHPEFAMPYWNYTSADPSLRGVLPVQFRMASDPSFACLYRPDRTTLANSGQPIQKNQAGDPMDISAALAATAYSTVGTVQGFCRAIDSGIHGRIHVLVGTSKDMGAVPYAARDPLFWVHHSSIDRMWASWNANGGVNPTTASWATKTFVFADGTGQQVTGALKDYFDTTSLGYVYDNLIPPVAATSLRTMQAGLAPSGNTAPERIASAHDAVDLGAGVVRVPLLPVPGVRRTAVLGLDPMAGSKKTYLVVKDLHTWKQPEVLYDVYLQPAHGGTGLNRSNLVGDINFFDAEFHDHGHGAMAEALGENFYSFDVTPLLREIARNRAQDARNGLVVSFVPAGRPTVGANPLVATVELRRQ